MSEPDNKEKSRGIGSRVGEENSTPSRDVINSPNTIKSYDLINCWNFYSRFESYEFSKHQKLSLCRSFPWYSKFPWCSKLSPMDALPLS